VAFGLGLAGGDVGTIAIGVAELLEVVEGGFFDYGFGKTTHRKEL
jgi:hypothetical protein